RFPPAEATKVSHWYSTHASGTLRTAKLDVLQRRIRRDLFSFRILVAGNILLTLVAAAIGAWIGKVPRATGLGVLAFMVLVAASIPLLLRYRSGLVSHHVSERTELLNLLARARRTAEAEATNSARAARGLITAADLMVRNEEAVREQIVSDLHDYVAQPLVA